MTFFEVIGVVCFPNLIDCSERDKDQKLGFSESMLIQVSSLPFLPNFSRLKPLKVIFEPSSPFLER